MDSESTFPVLGGCDLRDILNGRVSKSRQNDAANLTVAGKAVNGEVPVVKVNGEAAQSGRSIFSSSTISTSESSSAIINLGKIGKIELAPNTTISVSFNEKGLNGDLLAGKVTVLSADNVSIKTPNGKVTKLNAGESVMAQQKDDDDDDDGGAAWWIFGHNFRWRGSSRHYCGNR